MIHEFPNPAFCEASLALRYNLIGCVSAICHPNVDCPAVKRLLQAVYNADRAVQGNRPNSWNVTWNDLRATMAATLRIALEELEKP